MSLYPAGNQEERVPQPEADVLRTRLASVFGVGRGYWWPLSSARPPHAEAFQDYYFEHEFGYSALRRILSKHGVTSVFEFREDGNVYAVSLPFFEPCYSLLEGLWTSHTFDWVIYASHESSVTVAGEWLLPEVQAAWPDWERRVWTSPFYDRP